MTCLVINPNLKPLPGDLMPLAFHTGILRQIRGIKRAWLADLAYTEGGVTCLPDLITGDVARPTQDVAYQPLIGTVDGRKALLLRSGGGAGCGMRTNIAFDFTDAFTLYFLVAPTSDGYLLGDNDFSNGYMRVTVSNNPAGEIELRNKGTGSGAKSDAGTAAFNKLQLVMMSWNSTDKRVMFARNGVVQAAKALADAPVNCPNPTLFAQQPNLDNAIAGRVHGVFAFGVDHASSAYAGDRALMLAMTTRSFAL